MRTWSCPEVFLRSAIESRRERSGLGLRRSAVDRLVLELMRTLIGLIRGISIKDRRRLFSRFTRRDVSQGNKLLNRIGIKG